MSSIVGFNGTICLDKPGWVTGLEGVRTPSEEEVEISGRKMSDSSTGYVISPLSGRVIPYDD